MTQFAPKLGCLARGELNSGIEITVMRKSILAPLIFIALGVLFLLHNFNLVPNLGQLVAKWWPLILIGVGVGLLLKRR
jgi:hypothetical protein